MWRVVIRGSSGTLLKFSGLLIPIQLPQSTVHSSVIGSLLAVCAATPCADAGTQKTESQRNPKPTTALRLSPAPEQGLKFIVGDRRLDSLSFNGESLLASPKSGELRPERSAFRTVLDAVLTLSSAGVATLNKKPNTIELSYPWVRIPPPSVAFVRRQERRCCITILHKGAADITAVPPCPLKFEQRLLATQESVGAIQSVRL